MSSIDPGSMPPPPLMPGTVPMAALAYSIPMRRGRPGIITAIGVICLVVACLSGLSSFGSGAYAWGVYTVSKRLNSMAKSMRTVPVAPSSTSAPPAVEALSPGEVGVAVNALQTTLSLDGAHVRELDRLLRLHGREVLGGDSDTPLTGSAVQAEITGATSADSSGTPARFSTPQGSVDLFADHSVFTSSDGATTFNVSAKNNTDSPVFIYTAKATAGTGALTPAQVSQVVAAVQANAPPVLNPAQLKTLTSELSAANQSLVTPGSSTPVAAVNIQPDGTAIIAFDTGNVLNLSPQGRVVSAPPMVPTLRVSMPLVATLMLEAAGSIGLAILLLVTGTLVLRGTVLARRLLLIYAGLKIPLAIVAGIGLPYLTYQMAIGMSAVTSGSAPPLAGFMFWGCLTAGAGLALPIGLLIALRTRTARDYYNSAR